MGHCNRYMYSLYWAMTTLATVGYGDFSAANPAEALWATGYMFFNLALVSAMMRVMRCENIHAV